MRKLIHLIYTLGLIAVGASPLMAQDAAEVIVHCEVSIMCWNDELELTYPGYDGDAPILAPMQVRSASFHYDGPSVMQLELPVLDSEGKVIKTTPAAQVTIPLGLDQILVILLPQRSQAGLPYRSIVVDDRFETFPKQSLRFLNFTKNQLAGQLGENRFEIAPMGDTVSQPLKTIGSKSLVPFRMIRYVEATKTWRPVRSTAFSMPTNVRILVLVLENPTEPDLKFVLLRDQFAVTPTDAETPANP